MLSPRGGTSTGQLKLVPSPAFQQAAERRNRPGQGGGPARARHADVSVIPQACRRGLATFFFDGCRDRARPGITR
jgi:hypothetical protein